MYHTHLSTFAQFFQGYLYWLVAFYSSKLRPGYSTVQYLVASETQCVLVAGVQGHISQETWVFTLILQL